MQNLDCGLDWTGGLDYGLDWTGLIMDSDLDWWCRINVNNNDDHFNLYKVKLACSYSIVDYWTGLLD